MEVQGKIKLIGRSPDKNLVQQFINFWEQKYWLKLQIELELINN